jgi:hypothetical protein
MLDLFHTSGVGTQRLFIFVRELLYDRSAHHSVVEPRSEKGFSTVSKTPFSKWVVRWAEDLS